ncbi:hypothetical protein T03_14194 [Trichinella britovi]|uniref:Uncharacterized protein n=1 Tax=Trichinella britovi TaxID=45882 RepID=A0A0V1CMV1_TRIBR|nr:hypothetical protein T03_14194 [Trichinella britovi]
MKAYLPTVRSSTRCSQRLCRNNLQTFIWTQHLWKKKFNSEHNFNRQLMMFIEFVEYFIRRVIIIYSFDLKILIFIDRILCLQTGPIRTVVVRQKATVDKLAMV